MESPFCPVAAIRSDAHFRLIETFGYHPGRGIDRIDLHLARISASAAFFGLPFDLGQAKAHLAGLGGAQVLRCRLTLSSAGELELVTTAMPAHQPLWSFKVAAQRLVADDVFLAHKTTRRATYDQARAQLPQGIDELLFLNERGEICEGTISNIVVETTVGDCLTPPQSSGCLPGVYRQSLLNAGGVKEAVLTLDDLAKARDIRLVNSLRGEMQGIWVQDSEEFASFA